jgi:hypothetical protein
MGYLNFWRNIKLLELFTNFTEGLREAALPSGSYELLELFMKAQVMG